MIRPSPCSVPASCRAKRNPLRGERTDAEHGDGPSSDRANGWQFDRAEGTDQVAVVRVQRRQEEIRDDSKTALQPQTAGVRVLRGPESQPGLRRRGQGEDRGLRNELEPQSVSDLESNVARKHCSGGHEGGGRSEKDWWEHILGVPTLGHILSARFRFDRISVPSYFSTSFID
jgi:hypothetical protein